MRLIQTILDNQFIRRHRESTMLFLDVMLVCFAYIMAELFRVGFSVNIFVHSIKNFWWVSIFVVAVHIISFLLTGVNKSLWKYFGLSEVKNIVVSNLISGLVLIVFSSIVFMDFRYMSHIIQAEIYTTLLMFAIRGFYRSLRERTNMNRTTDKQRRALIIGAGDAGYILLKETLQTNVLNDYLVGFIDDYKVGRKVAGYKVIGSVADLPKIVKKEKIDIVYIAMPSVDFAYQKEVLEVCQSTGVKTKVMKKRSQTLKDTNGKLSYPVEDVSIEDLLGRGQVDLDTDIISEYISGKVIAVTGAGGSIGSELCRQILKFSPSVLLMIDVNENGLYMLEQELGRQFVYALTTNKIQVISLIASIREKYEIKNIFEKYSPDVVYHAAAHKHVPLMETRPYEAFKNNTLGTINVIESCIEMGVERFVLISTDKAVNPTNVMGASKRLAEMYLQSRGNNGVTKLAAVRFGNVLGSNGSVIPIFNEQIKGGGPITITHRDIIRYFMTIPEAAQLVLQAGGYANQGEIFVLDMGRPVKIIDLAKQLIRLSGYEPYQEIDIVEVGLRPGEKMFEELKLDNETVAKTGNDLIFVNHPMNINQAKLNEAINQLSLLISKQIKYPAFKDSLLETIKEDYTCTESLNGLSIEH